MRLINYIIVLLVTLFNIYVVVKGYRYAWRSDTKVFPYEKVPPTSRIDNGDNEGKILPDVLGRIKVETVITKCIPAWLGDGKCNLDNNKPDCKFDQGDCCGYTCKLRCQEMDLKGNDITNKTFAVLRRQDRPCPFECGVLDYYCLEVNLGCYRCNSSNSLCLSQ